MLKGFPQAPKGFQCPPETFQKVAQGGPRTLPPPSPEIPIRVWPPRAGLGECFRQVGLSCIPGLLQGSVDSNEFDRNWFDFGQRWPCVGPNWAVAVEVVLTIGRLWAIWV